MFRIKCKDEKYAVGISPCLTHPHNFYIQLLAETGIIGFLFLFSACYVLYVSLRQFKSIIFKQKRPINRLSSLLISRNNNNCLAFISKW
jgi:O-antigen ligase